MNPTGSRPRRTKRQSPTLVIPDERLPCHCGTTRRTTETLRVHRWLVHGEQS